jgi:hypothetical protein
MLDQNFFLFVADAAFDKLQKHVLNAQLGFLNKRSLV